MNIATIKLVLSLFPLLLETMRALETLIPVSGQGSAKLRLLQEAVRAAFEAAGEAAAAFEAAWPAIEKLVAATVGVLNSVGVFRKV